MTDLPEQPLIEPAQPAATWPFGWGEITAALRRHLDVFDLQISDIEVAGVANALPSTDHVQGLLITVTSASQPTLQAQHTFVLKEPQGSSRKGLAGVGRREVGFYHYLAREMPLPVPDLLAANRLGRWLIFLPFQARFTPKTWQRADYLQATTNLARLHDRFWQLGSDLTIYPWLGRPLSNDYEVHLIAADAALRMLVQEQQTAGLGDNPDTLNRIGHMLTNADKIVAYLQLAPDTLLNGNFWPGTVGLKENGQQLPSDWQNLSIGPGVLDLAQFIQRSRYWLDDDLPISPAELIAHYRQEMHQRIHYMWYDDAWQTLWDFALMWLFIQDWLIILAAMPRSLWQTRRHLIESVWLNPLVEAIDRQLPLN